jgi:hypothetical protein
VNGGLTAGSACLRLLEPGELSRVRQRFARGPHVGTLNGVIAATTPTGWRIIAMLRWARSAAKVTVAVLRMCLGV